MPIRLSLALIVLAASPVVSADNWPEFRGPHGDGTADAKGLPDKWGENRNVRWKTAIHDKGWSSPVIWGNQVWVTTATVKGDKCYAVALDRDTGKVIHDLLLIEVQLPVPKTDPKVSGDPFEKWEGFNSYASPTPAIEEGRVYVHFGATGTACLDTATGKPVWTRTDLKCGHHRGAGSSPVLVGDNVVLTFDGFDVQYLIALNKKTGDTAWKQDRNIHAPTDNGDVKKAYSTPLVVHAKDRDLLVSPSAKATAAYDPKTGEEVWRVIHGGMNASVRPVFGHGLVITAGSDGGKPLLAVRPDGTGDVTAKNVAWTYTKGSAPNRSSPVLVGDNLLMVNSNGIASCVDMKDGKELNKVRLESGAAKFTASPIVADGKWYAFDEDGGGYVLSADQKLNVIATNKLASGCKGSPAAVGSALYVRTNTYLYRIEATK